MQTEQRKVIDYKSFQNVSEGDTLRNKITGEYETIKDKTMYDNSNCQNCLYFFGKVYMFRAVTRTFEHEKGKFLIYGSGQ